MPHKAPLQRCIKTIETLVDSSLRGEQLSEDHLDESCDVLSEAYEHAYEGADLKAALERINL